VAVESVLASKEDFWWLFKNLFGKRTDCVRLRNELQVVCVQLRVRDKLRVCDVVALMA
jgi:hypothetical protein